MKQPKQKSEQTLNYRPIIIIFVIATILLAIGYALLTGTKSELYVSGQVVVSSDLREKAKDERVLYIILRDALSGGGMPYGAYRDRVNFAKSESYRFLITKEKLQIMGQQSTVPRLFNIKVRLDKDGVAGADAAGDIVGEAKRVAFGTQNMQVVLAREVK